MKIKIWTATAALFIPAMLFATNPIRSAKSANEFRPLKKAELFSPAMVSHAAPAMSAPSVPALFAPQPDETILLQMHPSEEEFNTLKVVDANNDGCTITHYYVEAANGNIYDWPIYYHRGANIKAADDWVFFPALDLKDKNNIYRVELEAACGGTFVSEAFEVKAGRAQTPEAMTIQIIDMPHFSGTDFSTIDGSLVIPEPGQYYVGIHIKSDAEAFRIFMRDIKIYSTSVSASVPSAPTDVIAYGAKENGIMTATVSFTMPTTAINATKLSTSEDVTVEVSCAGHTVSVKGKPGSKQTATIPCESLNNQIRLTSINSNGTGASIMVSILPKYDVPVDPVVTTKVSDDNMSMTCTWPHVVKGANGGTVNAEELTYNVYMYQETEVEEGVTQGGFALLQKGLKNPEFTLSVKAGTLQNDVHLVFTAQTDAGESLGDKCSVALESLGELYTLPFDEDMRNLQVKYSGYNVNTLDEQYYGAITGFSHVSSLDEAAGSGGAFCIITNESSAKALVNMPRINMKGGKGMVLTLSAWINVATAPTRVLMVGSDGREVEIGTISGDDVQEWREFEFAVPDEFGTLPWAHIRVISDMPSTPYFLMIERIYMRNLPKTDIEVISVDPIVASLGEKVKVNAVVKNSGSSTITSPKITAQVRSGRRVVEDVVVEGVPASLKSLESAKVTCEVDLKSFDYVGENYSLVVTAECDGDMNAANNSQSRIMNVRGSVHPVVNDLIITHNDANNGANLEWSNPVSDFTIESFELYDHGDYSSKLGPWLNLDFDGKEVYTVEGVQFPHDVVAKAFQVINVMKLGDSRFDTTDGYNFAIAFSAQEATSDDWLISPEITGGSTVEFDLNIVSYGFTESLEILASSTDRELDSFKPVQSIEKSNTGWELISVTLPEDARYFAIHYLSNDQFGIMIDNISYKSVESPYELVGFNIYRNGEKVNAAPVADTFFEHIHADYANSDYNVAVVAKKDDVETEYPLSNTVNLATISDKNVVAAATGMIHTTNGTILLTGFNDGDSVAAFTTTGANAATATINADGAAKLRVPAGLYIVKVGESAFKVIVK